MPSDREINIARRRAEIAEADLNTLRNGGRVNWSRQNLDRANWRLTGLVTFRSTRVDTIRGSHSDRTTVVVGVPLVKIGTRVDTIRASDTDSIRTTTRSSILGIGVQITHVMPDTSQGP